MSFVIDQGFFPGGLPHPAKTLSIPISDTCPHFWTKACPPPAEVRPRKFEKLKYNFCVKFDYFLAQKYLKKLDFMLKITKNGQILH